MKLISVILLGIVIISVIWQVNLQRQKGNFNLFTGQGIFNETATKTAPDFSGGGKWLNSEPLSLVNLKGKVVLVDFWTYSCINCQRTFPYLRSWWEKYKQKGLVIVGVHTPEFEFEKETENLIKANEKYGVTWPVVQDNDQKIWKAYGNQFWPHKYLINQEGMIVYDHIGEGAYEETELEIQKLLGISDMQLTQEPEKESSSFGQQQTPELYVNQRGEESGQIGKGRNRVELSGKWQIGDDYSSAIEDAKIKLDFTAAEVNLVMSLEDNQKGEVKVQVDGKEQDKISVDADDLYSLWKGTYGEHVLMLEFGNGLRVHAFTFGN